MKKNVSTPLSIPVVWSPLSTSFNIVSGDYIGSQDHVPGGPLSQWYYATGNTWEPDRRVTPLVLTPVLKGYDADTGTTYDIISDPSFQTEVKWYLCTSADEVGVLITASASSNEDYGQNSGGGLVVRKNIVVDEYARLLCKVRWVDPRNGVECVVTKDVTLTTRGIGEDAYTLRINRTREVRWNPLSELTPVQTLTASLRNGMEAVTGADLSFWWFKLMSDGSRVLIDDDAAVCAAYVSGQGTSSLVVDMDYLTEVTLECRASLMSAADVRAYMGTGNIENVLLPVREVRTLLWDLPDLSVQPYSPNGSGLTARTDVLTFRAVLQAGGADLPELLSQGSATRELSERVVLEWHSHPYTGPEDDVILGAGMEVSADRVQLTVNRRGLTDNIVVYPEVYVQEALLPLVDGNGKYIVDKALASGGKLVVGRVH